MVCLIDDDAAVRRALGLLLRTMGFAVEVFRSAEDFLRARNAAPPDCLVVDIHLGELSGFDLHERLVASGVSIPTIFITGHDDLPTRERAQHAGAAGYLQKPLDAHSLIRAIEGAVCSA
jgi:two-component system response regulator FixJ